MIVTFTHMFVIIITMVSMKVPFNEARHMRLKMVGPTSPLMATGRMMGVRQHSGDRYRRRRVVSLRFEVGRVRRVINARNWRRRVGFRRRVNDAGGVGRVGFRRRVGVRASEWGLIRRRVWGR